MSFELGRPTSMCQVSAVPDITEQVLRGRLKWHLYDPEQAAFHMAAFVGSSRGGTE